MAGTVGIHIGTGIVVDENGRPEKRRIPDQPVNQNIARIMEQDGVDGNLLQKFFWQTGAAMGAVKDNAIGLALWREY